MKTSHKDKEGNDIPGHPTEDGQQPKKDIPGYRFVETKITSPSIDKFTKEEANYAIQKLNLPSEGSYPRNKWVGYYYYKSDGKMAKNEWVDG
ncbi:hypothetical protein V470_10995 [Streptococcus sp. VT 162]|nr:hypothetical protein V470_10995 [Streptococcus sp. VT 162]